MSESKCAFNWPNCTNKVIDYAVLINPHMSSGLACKEHLLKMVDPVFNEGGD